jgi:hypothetical protein
MRLPGFLGVGASAGACAIGLVLLAAGCKHAGERLEGHWHGVRAEGVGADQQVAANAFAVGTELEFKAGTLHVKTPKDEQTGKYKVTAEDKQSVTVTTDRDGLTDAQTFYFPDDHTMRWQVLEGKALTFQKD